MRSPQSSSMRSPLIPRDKYMEPSLEPELDNAIPALHQYNGFSDDAKEPLLMSNEQLKASLKGDTEDDNSNDQLSSLKEIQGSRFFETSLNGINIIAGRAYNIYVRLCSSCASLCITMI